MKKAGIAVSVVGGLLLAVWIFAVLFFAFGFVMFLALDEVDYFLDYVVLNGYYAWVNILFIIDYILLFIGSPGLLVLIVGIVLAVIGAKKEKEKKAALAEENN